MTSGYKAQVVLKQFWDINSQTQVGTCKLCPQTKQSTAKPEYRMVQSGSKKAYPILRQLFVDIVLLVWWQLSHDVVC